MSSHSTVATYDSTTTPTRPPSLESLSSEVLEQSATRQPSTLELVRDEY